LHGGQGSRKEGEGAGEYGALQRLPEFFGLCHLKSGAKATEIEENANGEKQRPDEHAGLAPTRNSRQPAGGFLKQHETAFQLPAITVNIRGLGRLDG
jgi:hypothetical protein